MLLSLIFLSALVTQGPPSAPVVARPAITPFFSIVADAPGFWIECRNNTGKAVSSASPMWPWAPGRLRIDGELYRETGGVVGPGLSVDIAPGDLWRGIIVVSQSPGGPGAGAPVKFGANVRGGRVVHLSAGRHTIAVKCGDEWSAEYHFFWEDKP